MKVTDVKAFVVDCLLIQILVVDGGNTIQLYPIIPKK